MKISIGSRIIDGPWGGGNLFVINFKKYLIENGHEVIHDLCHKDIDIILLTDPRSRKDLLQPLIILIFKITKSM